MGNLVGGYATFDFSDIVGSRFGGANGLGILRREKWGLFVGVVFVLNLFIIFFNLSSNKLLQSIILIFIIK